jgi:ribonuclease P protein component
MWTPGNGLKIRTLSLAVVETRSGIAKQAMNSTASPAGPVKLQSMVGARLRKHADYQRAYLACRKKQSSSMSWFLAPQSSEGTHAAGPRIGLTVGKVLGKAHERNRIKRRMREALRRHLDLLPAGVDLILHPRRIVLTIEFAKLEAEVIRILKQAKMEQQAKTEAARNAQDSSLRTAPVTPAAKPAL